MKVNFSGIQLRSRNHADRSNKVIDAMTVFGSQKPKTVIASITLLLLSVWLQERNCTPEKLTFICSPHPPLRGPPSPKEKAKENAKLQFEIQHNFKR